MRIFDVEGNELQEEDVDLELGHLEDDQLFVQHHDATEEIPREAHYVVSHFYFEDGTKYDVEDEDDPHVGKDDVSKGLFHFEEQPDDEIKGRTLRGIDIFEKETQAYVPAQAEWDEYEDIKRYILYTEEELEEIEEQKRKEERQAELLETGLDRIETNEVDIEDLILLMADVVGGEEYEEEEEPVEEV